MYIKEQIQRGDVIALRTLHYPAPSEHSFPYTDRHVPVYSYSLVDFIQLVDSTEFNGKSIKF